MSIVRRRKGGSKEVSIQLTKKQIYLGTEEKLYPEKAQDALDYIVQRDISSFTQRKEYYETCARKLAELVPNFSPPPYPLRLEITTPEKVKKNQ